MTEIPEEIRSFEELQSVDSIAEVQDSYADYVIILDSSRTNEVRVHYLENFRNKWEWVDSATNDRHDNGYLQIQRRDN
jgi:hypothetical protein